MSRSTKSTLNRLGVFTVSSFHAYICARSPSLLNNLLAGRGATRRRSAAAALGAGSAALSRSNSLSSRKSQTLSLHGHQSAGGASADSDKLFRVNLPDGQVGRRRPSCHSLVAALSNKCRFLCHGVTALSSLFRQFSSVAMATRQR